MSIPRQKIDNKQINLLDYLENLQAQRAEQQTTRPGSRRLKLYVSRSSSSSAVATLTRSALLDWGVPEMVVTDNGSDYVSNHIKNVFMALNIEQFKQPGQ